MLCNIGESRVILIMKSTLRSMKSILNLLLSPRIVAILKELSVSAKTRKQLRTTLDVSSSVLAQTLNRMISMGLIEEKNDIVFILPKGLLILKIIEILEGYNRLLKVFGEYTNNYLLDDIPEYLVKRFYELSEINIVEMCEDCFQPHREFIRELENSNKIYGYSTVFFSEYIQSFLKFAEDGKIIKIAVSKDVLRRILKDYKNELEKGLEYDTVEFYVSNRDFRFSFVVTDRFFSISFYLRNNLFDYKRDFVCKSEDCIRWGKDLFSYVVMNSTRVCKESLKELVRDL